VSVVILALVILHRPVEAVRLWGLGKMLKKKITSSVAPFRHGNRHRQVVC
jgi:hypothetical protein